MLKTINLKIKTKKKKEEEETNKRKKNILQNVVFVLLLPVDFSKSKYIKILRKAKLFRCFGKNFEKMTII